MADRWCETFGEQRGTRLQFETFNLYHANHWIIKPATDGYAKKGCSMVEIMAIQVQRPHWFEPVCKFLACLEQHALVRELSSSTFYWVCAYANNQHCVEEDIKSNPRSTSFYRAMQMSEGVLLVLDSAGTPFGFSWSQNTMAETGRRDATLTLRRADKAKRGAAKLDSEAAEVDATSLSHYVGTELLERSFRIRCLMSVSVDIPGHGYLDIKLTATSTAADIILLLRERLPDSPWHGNKLLSSGVCQLQCDDIVEATRHSTLILTNYSEITNQEAFCIEDTAERGITREQLAKIVVFISKMADRWCDGYAKKGCSMVELMAIQVQRPHWFVSHAWIEPVCKFLACLEQHALVRELSSSTFYWVCAYANNQHCVEEDIKSNPRSTSFYRAMQMSEGVLLSKVAVAPGAQLERRSQDTEASECPVEVITCIKVFSRSLHEKFTAAARMPSTARLTSFESRGVRTLHRLLSLELLEKVFVALFPLGSGQSQLDAPDLGATETFCIKDTAERGITREQLAKIVVFISKMADRWCDGYAKKGCSMVEIMAIQVQRPQWFVSHAWSEPVYKFLACLEQHALVRELSSSTFYWVCAYANNQHSVDEDIKKNPRSTSFYRAMQKSEGVLLVLDSAGKPFGLSNLRVLNLMSNRSKVAVAPGAQLERRSHTEASECPVEVITGIKVCSRSLHEKLTAAAARMPSTARLTSFESRGVRCILPATLPEDATSVVWLFLPLWRFLKTDLYRICTVRIRCLMSVSVDIPGHGHFDIKLTASSTAADIILLLRERLPDSPWHGNKLLSSGVCQLQCDDIVEATHHSTVVLTNYSEITSQDGYAKKGCSMVELMAIQVQRPHWFVSHAWIEPVCKFLACLEQHALVRELSSSTFYWVCAYANNQIWCCFEE
ncbi:unnamed protein product, partial [Cladocopium goreaui]